MQDDESFDQVQDSLLPIELPPCELSKLEEIETVIQNSAVSQYGNKEELANQIENKSFIPKLIEIFRMCEDLENEEGLFALFGIFKAIFLLEKNSLFEIMFTSDNILDIIGILEYDPSKSERNPHREYINEYVQFKEVIPFTNEELLNKIHQTFRVQYIKDILVPVPSLFDESMSTLNSFLFFNKIQIIDLILVCVHLFLFEFFLYKSSLELFFLANYSCCKLILL